MSETVRVELVEAVVHRVVDGSVLVLRYPPSNLSARDRCRAIQEGLVGHFERVNLRVVVLVLPEGVPLEHYRPDGAAPGTPELPWPSGQPDLPFDGWGRTPEVKP